MQKGCLAGIIREGGWAGWLGCLFVCLFDMKIEIRKTGNSTRSKNEHTLKGDYLFAGNRGFTPGGKVRGAGETSGLDKQGGCH